MVQDTPNRFNFSFDEKFMDAVVRRVGGIRLTERFTVPEGVENVDYLIGHHAVELKTLEVEPLEHADRQTRMRRFVAEEQMRGTPGINIDPATQFLELTGEAARKFWERELGNTVRKAMMKAASQIAATRALVDNSLRGAVIVMNVKSKLVDGRSLIELMAHYRNEFPELDICIGYTALLSSINGAEGQVFGAAAGGLPHPRDVALDDMLRQAIQDEITARGYASKRADSTGAMLAPLQAIVEMPSNPGMPPLRMHPRPGPIGQQPDFRKKLFYWWKIAHQVSREAKCPETTNCHYFPQFLMRRWAQSDGQIRYVSLATGDQQLDYPDAIACLQDLYTTSAPDSAPDRRLVEAFLSCGESEAAAVLAKLDTANWSMSAKHKEVLSLFLAVLVVRLPHVIETIMDQYRQDWKPEWGVESSGRPHRGNFILRLLQNEEPFTASGPILHNLSFCFFHQHRWTFVLFAPGQRMPTGDVPISLNAGNGDLPPDKWEIRIPLGPSILLTTNNRNDTGTPYPIGVYPADPEYKPTWEARGMKYRFL